MFSYLWRLISYNYNGTDFVVEDETEVVSHFIFENNVVSWGPTKGGSGKDPKPNQADHEESYLVPIQNLFKNYSKYITLY